jgi:hypothetical protein
LVKPRTSKVIEQLLVQMLETSVNDDFDTLPVVIAIVNLYLMRLDLLIDLKNYETLLPSLFATYYDLYYGVNSNR